MKRTFLTWGEVFARLRSAPTLGPTKVYGIPRGGGIVAALLSALLAERGREVRIVETAAEADLIVDDIIDSGRTIQRVLAALGPSEGHRRHWALVDKTTTDRNIGWVVFPWENPDPTADLQDMVQRELEFIDPDPHRAGLVGTPDRVARAMMEMTNGYGQDEAAILSTTFDADYDEMVVVDDIPFHSLCEHHILPFTGTARVGYIPNGRVVGLSKIPRLVDAFSHRLQIQERLTSQIAHSLMSHTDALGVGVVMRGHHTCMTMRGIKSSGRMTTSCLLGVIKDKPEARAEFLGL